MTFRSHDDPSHVGPALPANYQSHIDGLNKKSRCPQMAQFDRITFNPAVMGGKPCIRGLRVTVGMVLGLLAAGRTREEILKAYPYLKPEDIDQCLAYAAWRVEERDVPLGIS